MMRWITQELISDQLQFIYVHTATDLFIKNNAVN